MRSAAASGFERSFVKVRRSYVLDGSWAALRRDAGPSAARLAPVLWALSRGTPEARFARTTHLRELCGLSRAAFTNAFVGLRDSGAVQLLDCASPRVEHFRVENHVLALPGIRSTRVPWWPLPGRLFADGRWAELPSSACSVLVALAASAEPVVYVRDDGDTSFADSELASLPEQLHTALMDDSFSDPALGGVDEEAYESSTVRRACRVAVLTYDAIAARAGVCKGSVSRAVDALAARMESPLVSAETSAYGTLFQLPAPFWG